MQSDTDPVLEALRTGAIATPTTSDSGSGAGNDPVIAALRSGNVVDQSGKPDKASAKATGGGGQSFTQSAGEFLLNQATGLGAAAIAGGRSVYDLATGKPLSEVDKANHAFIDKYTYQPRGAAAKAVVENNPLNLIGNVWGVVADTINNATDPNTWNRRVDTPAGNPLLADKAGTVDYGPPSTAPRQIGTGSTVLGPVLSGIGQVAMGAAPFFKGGVRAPEIPTNRATPGWGPGEPRSTPTPSPTTSDTTAPNAEPSPAATATAPSPADLSLAPSAPRTMPPAGRSGPTSQQPLSASGAPRAGYFEPQDVPGRPGVHIDTEPVEGGLPDAAAKQRAAILQRVGLENARDSALEGNAKNAATDWQLTKFDEPAGVRAKAQFDAERQALQQHAQDIVERTGGTVGTDEDSLNIRGQTIARPFDELADWFDEQRGKLYQAADERSGGHPVVQPLSLQALLDDPSFKNQLTARDQMHIRNGVAAELGRFQENNPAGLTVQNAEQFRQFLNTLWSPENSNIIGRMKGSLDDDVMKGAGEDLYGPARQLAQLQKQTLDNPSGISKLLERDPQTPINRTTPYVRIPDTLTRLDPAQFDNVVKTLQTMPESIQPAAHAALGEIKAHLANKVLDAGSSTSGQWNARGVEKVVKANSAKLQSAFADQPELLSSLQDLRSAGNILSVNQSYPGAAAQAANALKRGMMSRALSRVGATAGAGVGSILGPFGAAGGAAVGESVGARAGQSVAERAAVKKWESGMSKLSDLVK